MQEIVLLASSSESVISAWDLRTGTHLTSYKSSACSRNCLGLVGHDYLVAAQNSKDALQFWTWHKDQVLQRSFAMERLTSVTATADGMLLAGGGASGAVYVWETASGRLLRNWPAHYKAVTALAFSASGDVLVSGSEDTLVSAWLVADLLDCEADTSSAAYMRPQPLRSWSQHTLPVTSLQISTGGCQSAALVYSASLDRTVKIHTLAHDGPLLASAQLPCGATCIAVDAAEHTLYAGGADGAVYEFSLIGDVPDVSAGRGAGGGGAGAGIADGVFGDVAGATVLRPYAVMAAHSRTVNAVCVSNDGEYLVSGSDDGTAQVWHLRSRQAVQLIQSPSKLPVSCVLVLPRPPHLTVGGSGSVAGGGRAGPKRLQPLAPLVKYAGMSGTLKPWESAPVVLDGSNSNQCTAPHIGGVLAPPDTEMSWLQDQAMGLQGSVGSQLGTDSMQIEQGVVQVPVLAANGDKGVAVGVGGAVDEVTALKQALAAARKEAESWQKLHSELHAYVVRTTLTSDS